MNMTIGTLAKKAGVSLQTLRFYEERGLLSPTHRALSGYRFYDSESLRRLKFIRHAQDFGFSLKEIGFLLKLNPPSASACGRTRKKAEAKVRQIRQKVQSLQKIARSLESLILKCRHKPKQEACPILSRFYGGTNGHEKSRKLEFEG